MTKKILSAEFKRECAELVINHSYKHNDAAKAMDVAYRQCNAGLVNTEKNNEVLRLNQVP